MLEIYLIVSLVIFLAVLSMAVSLGRLVSMHQRMFYRQILSEGRVLGKDEIKELEKSNVIDAFMANDLKRE